jgi:pectate lyase
MRFPSSPWRAGWTLLGVLVVLAATPVVQAQTVLFTDDFQDGNANGWTVLGGTWSVITDGSLVYNQSGRSSRYRSGAGSLAWTDYSVEARVKPTGWNGTDRFAGLAARLRDRNNAYVLALRSSGRVELVRIVGGSATVLATRAFPVALGSWYALRVDAVGTTLRGYVDGSLQFTATDATFASGQVGGATDYASASFDDFRVIAGGIPPGNQAPQVQAGGDQAIVLSAAASLFGSVSDDGLPAPPGAVTCAWSRTAGPGTVTFTPSASALTATARFSAVGLYTLTLACSDSQLSGSDSMGVDVRPDSDPPPPPEQPVGFASVNALGQNGTTGGQGGPVVTVTTAAQLLDFIARPGPYVIRVDGMIVLPAAMHNVASHKTIVGVGAGSGLTGGGLNIGDPVSESTTPPPGGGVRNVIIRNLTFRDSPDDAINVQMFAHHVWIDHNDLSDCFDGLIDIKRGADFVTVSWNHTHHHTKNMLLGHSDSNAAQDVGHLKVTYHHNWFDDTPQRNPRVRFGDPVHIFNNYYFSNSDVGVACQANSGCLVEGNYFEDVEEPMTIRYAGPAGRLVQRDNVFVGESGTPVVGGSVGNPAAFYSYTLDNPADVKAIVMQGAGVGVLPF